MLDEIGWSVPCELNSVFDRKSVVALDGAGRRTRRMRRWSKWSSIKSLVVEVGTMQDGRISAGIAVEAWHAHALFHVQRETKRRHRGEGERVGEE